MALAHSPQIVTNGLVFYYDMANTKKSWFGKPTTNFYTNGHFSNGTGIAQESGSNATNTVIFFPYNPGNSEYVLEQSGGPYTEYQINLSSQLLANTTYVLSGWYGESIDYVGESRMFHCRAFSSSGANVALGNGIGTVLETRVINGITWKYCYDIITTPSDYSNDFNWYLGYGGGSYTGKRYYTNVQMEQGNYPNRFVNGTRSNTQAIVDLTGRRTIGVGGSPAYGSDGTFTFSSSGSTTLNLGSGNNFLPMPSLTLEAWIKTPGLGSGMSVNGIWGFTYGIRFNAASDGSLYFIIGTDVTTFVNIATSGVNVNDNNWHHVVAVKNGDFSCAIYVDGVVRASGTPVAGWSGTNPWVAMEIQVGRDQNDNPYFFNGRIDVGRVYNRALTASEVQQNFNAQRGRYGI